MIGTEVPPHGPYNDAEVVRMVRHLELGTDLSATIGRKERLIATVARLTKERDELKVELVNLAVTSAIEERRGFFRGLLSAGRTLQDVDGLARVFNSPPPPPIMSALSSVGRSVEEAGRLGMKMLKGTGK